MSRMHWKITINKWEDDKYLEPTQTDLEIIAKQIKEGYTEGHI